MVKAAVFMEMAAPTKAIIPRETHPWMRRDLLCMKLTKGVIFSLAITCNSVSCHYLPLWFCLQEKCLIKIKKQSSVLFSVSDLSLADKLGDFSEDPEHFTQEFTWVIRYFDFTGVIYRFLSSLLHPWERTAYDTGCQSPCWWNDSPSPRGPFSTQGGEQSCPQGRSTMKSWNLLIGIGGTIWLFLIESIK